jgi:hypothetical protein
VAGEIFVARCGKAANRRQGCGRFRFNGIPKGVMNFATESMGLGAKVEGNALNTIHRGHLNELKTEPYTLSSIAEIQL